MNRPELNDLICFVRMGQTERDKALDKLESQFGAYIDCLSPLTSHDRKILREKADQLSQTDGEGWAIGEMIMRACIMFDALEAGEKTEAKNSEA